VDDRNGEQLRQEQQTADSLKEKDGEEEEEEEENTVPQEQAVHDARRRPPQPLQSLTIDIPFKEDMAMARGRFKERAKVVSQQQTGSKNADTVKVDTSNISVE